MPTPPTDLPRWATDETNNTEPTEGKKDTGFEVGEKPISSTAFNWLLNVIYQWLSFYQTRTRFVQVQLDGATSWTSDGVVVTSAGVGETIYLPLHCTEGDSISAIDVLVRGDGSVDANVTIVTFDTALAETDIGTVLDSNRANAWAFLNIPVTGSPHVVAAGEQVLIKAVSLAAGYKIAGIRITP